LYSEWFNSSRTSLTLHPPKTKISQKSLWNDFLKKKKTKKKILFICSSFLLFSSNFHRSSKVHPGGLTWNIITEVCKMIFRSKWVICRFHVNLPGCIKKTSMLFSNFQLVSPFFGSPTSKVRLSDLHLTSEVFMNGWRAIGSTLPIKAKIHNYACHQYIYNYLQISTNHIYIQYQVKNNLLLTSMLLII